MRAGSPRGPGPATPAPARGAPSPGARTVARAGAGSTPSTSGSRVARARRDRSPCPSVSHRPAGVPPCGRLGFDLVRYLARVVRGGSGAESSDEHRPRARAGLYGPGSGGVAAEPRGAAAARRRSAGAAAPDRASGRRRGGGPALGFPGGPMAAPGGTLRSYLRSSTAPRRPPAPRSAGSTRCIGRSPAPATRRATRRCRCGSTPRSSSRRWPRTTHGSSRSPANERAAFYEETRPIGRAFGVPEAQLPADLEAFDRYLEPCSMLGGPVRVSPLARELATAVLSRPSRRWPAGCRAAPRRGCRGSRRACTTGPVAVRRPAAGDGSGGLRPAMEPTASAWSRNGSSPGGAPGDRCLPSFRQMPHALAADRRMDEDA